MSRVKNRWEDEASWNYHITSKNIMREVIESEDDKDLERLNEINFDENLNCDGGEGDPPNMDYIRKGWAEYYAYAEKKGIPLLTRPWLKRAGDWIVSLYRQDSAYAERIGGIINYVIFNEKAWKKCRNKKQRLEFLTDTRDWWNENDARDRTRGWIMKMWNRVLRWYEKDEFWEQSINFLINWALDHKNKWQPHQMYDPKVWFPAGRGSVNNAVHGGMA